MDNKELEKLKKILESCHINFLIGSGASMNYLNTLNDIENLLSAIENKRIGEPKNEEYKIVEASIKYSYFKKSIRGNLGFIDDKIAEEKIEVFKETKDNYNQFILALNTILIRRKSNIINRQINLFTTNMDLFLDSTLESNGIECNDGFSGRLNPIFSTSNYKKTIFQNSPHYDNRSELPVFNLFKLHGSVNWRKEKINGEEAIIYDPNLTAINQLNHFELDEKELIQIDDKETLAQLIKKAKDKKSNKSIDQFLDAYRKLVMVNPTKGKFELTTIDYNFYEQLRMYSNALEKENSILFVTGFSFADEHIREITQRVAKSNPTLMIYIFCYSEEDKIKIENWFSGGKFSNIIYRAFSDIAFSFKTLIETALHPIASEFDKDYFGNTAKETAPIVTLENNTDENV